LNGKTDFLERRCLFILVCRFQDRIDYRTERSISKEKKMKKFAWFLTLMLVFTLVLSACGVPATKPPTPAPTEVPTEVEATEVPATEAPTATEAPATGKFRVAVVMPSAINDLAFSQSMYDALVRVQQEMGEENFEFVYSEGMFVVDDAAAAIRDYASQGFNLVIAHGSQYGSSLAESDTASSGSWNSANSEGVVSVTSSGSGAAAWAGSGAVISSRTCSS
jgi:hypothetical protein